MRRVKRNQIHILSMHGSTHSVGFGALSKCFEATRSAKFLLCRLFSHGFLGALCVFNTGGHLLCTLGRVHGGLHSSDKLCWISSRNMKGWNVLVWWVNTRGNIRYH